MEDSIYGLITMVATFVAFVSVIGACSWYGLRKLDIEEASSSEQKAKT